jgi:hypothetical protein
MTQPPIIRTTIRATRGKQKGRLIRPVTPLLDFNSDSGYFPYTALGELEFAPNQSLVGYASFTFGGNSPDKSHYVEGSFSFDRPEADMTRTYYSRNAGTITLIDVSSVDKATNRGEYFKWAFVVTDDARELQLMTIGSLSNPQPIIEIEGQAYSYSANALNVVGVARRLDTGR